MSSEGPPEKRKLIDIVRTYQALLRRVDDYLHDKVEHAEIVALLNLSSSNYYSKRQGVRRFTYEEVGKLLDRFGKEEERQQYREFIEVRDKVYNLLLLSRIPMAQYRRVINLNHHKLMLRRRDHPSTWKVEDLEKIGLFIESIAYI